MFIHEVLGQLLYYAAFWLCSATLCHHHRMLNLLKNILTTVEVLLQRIPLFCGLR